MTLTEDEKKSLEPFRKAFLCWINDRILAGFGHEGMNAVSVIHKKYFQQYINWNCTACATSGVERVWSLMDKE